MKINTDGELAVFDRFDQIEAILQRYPDIDDAELADLKRWFCKEASAFEVASLAGKDSVERQYGEFRKAHVDRLTPLEIAAAMAVVVVLLAGFAAVALA
tara:strand:+ start:313 stop:609 length:297 start_codon:yes stop_codon:yes gene_type:complete